ncbi:hypothetical protein RISK_001472 [Rhodopirellula islandica]|uniref:Transmembrane protein n=1 Tax=Rhodopirellula islandica TaxID=595434 RepID=A0A0J1BI77_RHOIS|nr:hypothetical protein RISK_001472 [Rhodopirellula islandica]
MERKEILDVAVGFLPLALTCALVPLHFDVARGGAVVLAVVLCLPRLWWSCVFGLL